MEVVEEGDIYMIICLCGLVLGIIGVIVIFPKMKCFIECKKTVSGEIIDVLVDNASEERPVKVTFSYNVLGENYRNHTRWTTYGRYRKGSIVTIKYNERRPQKSYLVGDGSIIRMLVGLLFTVVGIFIILIGCIVGI
jgi:hypothetical protein